MPEDRTSSSPDFSELEKNLGRLRPRGLDGAFEPRLSRQMELAESGREQQRVLWARFAPVAGLSLAVLIVALGVRTHLRQATGTAGAEPRMTAVEPTGNPGETTSGAGPRAPGQTDASAGNFLPVSHQNYLRAAQDAGIIDTGTSIPARRVRLEFEDDWRWHDPETQTNIQVIRPREEIILVPVETD